MDARRSAPGEPPPPGPARDEPPPILGSWSALYALVIGELLLVILLCQWLTGRGQ
jgi:hypothetical protein